MRKIARGYTLSLSKGFTLVELLVVIAIISILAAVVMLVINPLELTRRSRDAARMTDLANLQQAINVSLQDATTTGSQILCDDAAYPCQGQSDSTDANNRKSDGSGWIKVDLSSAKSVSVPTLPVDPTNSTTYVYRYCADKPTGKTDGWEIDATLESDQQKGKMASDGGNDDVQYEVGSNLELIGGGSPSCTF